MSTATTTNPRDLLDSTTKLKVSLMGLPAELRLAIYDFHFSSADLIEPRVIHIVERDLFTRSEPRQEHMEPALLRTSFSLRSEAVGSYHKELRKAGAGLKRHLDLISKTQLSALWRLALSPL